MKLTFKTILFLVLVCVACRPPAEAATPALLAGVAHQQVKAELVARFGADVPRQWGERVPGVKTRLATTERLLALTLDACGSSQGMDYDAGLLEFLSRERIPATLFINARWIDQNRAAFVRLAGDSLFEIANHGLLHKPASVTGRFAYGLPGTRSVAELVDEIALGAARIEALTGRRPGFYRAGTAYYDEVAVRVANALGQQVAGFSILGDAGATYTREEVRAALLKAQSGDIILLHMNHPESGTRAGVIAAVSELKRRGFRFVRLSEVPLAE